MTFLVSEKTAARRSESDDTKAYTRKAILIYIRRYMYTQVVRYFH